MRNKKTGREAYIEQISRQQLVRMLVALAAYTGIGVALYFLAVTLYRQFVWQRDDFIYWVVNWLDTRTELLTIIYIVVGYCAIFLYYRSKPFKFLYEILEATDSIFEQDSDLIELSLPLKNVELQMNQLKMTVRSNERAARDAEQRKNDLVMYLAHDIKTPLTSVIGYLSLLDEAPDIPLEQKAKYLRLTLEKAYRLERLIDEFFEITRYNLQTISLSMESIDLYCMLAQMSDEFYPLLTAKGKQTTLHVPEDMTIYGDPDKLARVFNNVLKNAVAYSPENSVIDISAALSGDRASIVFTNAGSIPKDKLATIFDKFYRLDSARSTDTGGAGLGLAIAKEIVASHGGSIYADSDKQQTTFTIELPV